MIRRSSQSLNNQKITFAMTGIIGSNSNPCVARVSRLCNGLWMSTGIRDM
jgi:hypothetical protein